MSLLDCGLFILSVERVPWAAVSTVACTVACTWTLFSFILASFAQLKFSSQAALNQSINSKEYLSINQSRMINDDKRWVRSNSSSPQVLVCHLHPLTQHCTLWLNLALIVVAMAITSFCTHGFDSLRNQQCLLPNLIMCSIYFQCVFQCEQTEPVHFWLHLIQFTPTLTSVQCKTKSR